VPNTYSAVVVLAGVVGVSGLAGGEPGGVGAGAVLAADHPLARLPEGPLPLQLRLRWQAAPGGGDLAVVVALLALVCEIGMGAVLLVVELEEAE
jgi:hypothetical protein